jgi:two-component system phosphate regulon sensor histidine kinase PhoR
LEEINFDDEGVVPYDELAPFAKRINEQRQVNDRQLTSLQNRSDTINAITNNMQEGLILLDDSGKVMTANRSALAVFGATEHWAPDTDILHICRDFDFQQKVKACLQGENTEMTWQSENRFYTIYFSPVLSSEEIIGGVVLLFDITEQRRAEQLRREFSANVSHELKTPLTSISAISEMISTGMAKDEDIVGFATKISEQARRLVSIIDDIIKLSEFDEGKREKDYSEFDLRELALVVIDALKTQADEKGITVTLEAEYLPMVAEKQMIDELLFNLIDNAIKYNKQAGSVSVALSEHTGLVKIAVSDSGVGIAPEHQDRIFERFYRVDPSRSKQTGGSGLGLSIVKHIAEYHGGYVELESQENQGTTISCYIPKH